MESVTSTPPMNTTPPTPPASAPPMRSASGSMSVTGSSASSAGRWCQTARISANEPQARSPKASRIDQAWPTTSPRA